MRLKCLDFIRDLTDREYEDFLTADLDQLRNECRPMYYMATPYSDPDPKVMERRYGMAEHFQQAFLMSDIMVYSPIAACHNMVQRFKNLRADWEFWQMYDFAMIDRLSGLIVVQMEGWQCSRGVKAEFNRAYLHHKPIFFVTEGEAAEGNMKDAKYWYGPRFNSAKKLFGQAHE